jgi:hypothetical protein
MLNRKVVFVVVVVCTGLLSSVVMAAVDLAARQEKTFKKVMVAEPESVLAAMKKHCDQATLDAIIADVVPPYNEARAMSVRKKAIAQFKREHPETWDENSAFWIAVKAEEANLLIE